MRAPLEAMLADAGAQTPTEPRPPRRSARRIIFGILLAGFGAPALLAAMGDGGSHPETNWLMGGFGALLMLMGLGYAFGKD